jgi:hypothetical protein
VISDNDSCIKYVVLKIHNREVTVIIIYFRAQRREAKDNKDPKGQKSRSLAFFEKVGRPISFVMLSFSSSALHFL